MQEIVREILDIEAEVEDTLQKAQAKAEEIRLDTERRISQKLAAARQKAKQIVEKAFEEAKEAAYKAREKELSKAKEAADRILQPSDEVVAGLVKEILELIIHTQSEERKK